MKESKRHRLQAAGWRVGSAAEFLGLDQGEETLIEMKLALANQFKRRRHQQRLTQVEIARKIGSSQSRIAKMEIADSTVSLDLLVRSLLSLGATPQEIARAIGVRSARTNGHRRASKKREVARS
jgi:hypothetical protein